MAEIKRFKVLCDEYFFEDRCFFADFMLTATDGPAILNITGIYEKEYSDENLIFMHPIVKEDAYKYLSGQLYIETVQ